MRSFTKPVVGITATLVALVSVYTFAVIYIETLEFGGQNSGDSLHISLNPKPLVQVFGTTIVKVSSI